MKRIALLIGLLCLTLPSLAQELGGNASYYLLKTRLGVSISGKAYTGTTNDTTQWMNVANAAYAGIWLAAEDSATILIYAQPGYSSASGIAASTALVLLDSLSTATAGSGMKLYTWKNLPTTVAPSAQVAWGPVLRFAFVFSAIARPLGTGTPKYSAYAILKP